MDYQALRTFADSWGLLSMTLVFIGVLAWAFRPSARKHHEDARMIPFREEEADQ